MWSSAANALQWLTDKLLTRHAENAARKQAKWNQVATFLDELSGTIDSAVAEFRANRQAYAAYGELLSCRAGFNDVLRQIYKDDEIQELHKIRGALEAVLHLVQDVDGICAVWADDPTSKEGKEALNDLQMAAGQFRGLAKTLRARA